MKAEVLAEISQLRGRIDAVDDELLAVLAKRFALAAEMRELKARENLPGRDEAREREIFNRVLSKCEAAERDTVFGIYERLFNGSRGVVETIARGVAVRDGKVLLCRAKGGETSYLPGGHIEFGETAAVALAREVMEELGVEAEVGDFLGVVENTFLQHGRRHCEINLVYRMSLAEMTSGAREDWIEFEWRDCDDLDAAGLLPAAMKEYVKCCM